MIDGWFQNAPKMTRIEEDLYNLSGRLPNSYINRLETAGFSVVPVLGGYQVTKDGHSHFASYQAPQKAQPGEGSRWSNRVYQKIITQGPKSFYRPTGSFANRREVIADATDRRRTAGILKDNQRRSTASPTPIGSTHTAHNPKFVLRKPDGTVAAQSLTLRPETRSRGVPKLETANEIIKAAAFAPPGSDKQHLKAQLADKLKSAFDRSIPEEIADFGSIPMGDVKGWFNYGQRVKDYIRQHPERKLFSSYHEPDPDGPTKPAWYAGPIISPTNFFRDIDTRPATILNINGREIPFYVSTGQGGKKNVKSGQWYPFFGIGTQVMEGTAADYSEFGIPKGRAYYTNWLNKTSESDINRYYDSPELKAGAEYLNTHYPAERDKDGFLHIPAVGDLPRVTTADMVRFNAPFPKLPAASHTGHIPADNIDYATFGKYAGHHKHLDNVGNRNIFKDFQQHYMLRGRNKYEGLNDIIKEATQQTSIAPADIGAEVDHSTKRIKGGISSYIEEVLPPEGDTPIVKSGKRRYQLNENGSWDRIGGPPTKTEQAAINKANFEFGEMTPRTPITGDITGHYGAIREQQVLVGEGRRKWREQEDYLRQVAFQKQFQKSLSSFSAASTQMAEASHSLAFGSRFKLSDKLAKYETEAERREYLHDAGFDPDAAYGQSILKLAQREYDRTHDVTKSVDWKRYGRGAEAQWNSYTNPNLRSGDITWNDGYLNGWKGKNPNPWWQNQYTKNNPLGFNWEGRAWYGPTKIQSNNPGTWLGVQGKDIKSYRAKLYGDPTNANYSGLGSDAMFLQDPGPWRGVAHISDRARDGLAVKPDSVWGSQDYIDKAIVQSEVQEASVGKVSGTALMHGVSVAAKGLQILGTIAERVGKTLQEVWEAQKEQAKGIYSAGEYFVPGPLKGATSRYFKAGMQAIDSVYTKRNGAIEGGGQIATGAGMMLTGNFVGGAGKVIQGAGTLWTSRIKSRGLDVQSRINMWSGFTELILAPIKLISNAARWLWDNFRKLGASLINVVAQFNQLGLPLTMLTGVRYSGMQRSYVADAMIGRSKGTTNSVYESFAGAQQDLFTFGKLDEHRLISAAMLGVFNNVYANGGDTQAQYGNMVNTIYRQLQNASPSGQQRIMNLARGIDDTLPARLQQMMNLGISDYRRIQDGSLMKSWLVGTQQYTATDAQRARYTRAGMEYTALSESIGESKNVIAERLWRSIGKPLMSGVNEIFHMLANGGSWRQALAEVKARAKELWGHIAKEFGVNEDFGQFVGDIGIKIKSMLWGILPTVGDVVSKVVTFITEGFASVLETCQPIINRFITELSTVRFEFDWMKKEFKITTAQSRQREYMTDQATENPAIRWNDAKEFTQFAGHVVNGQFGRLRDGERKYRELMGMSDSFSTPMIDELETLLLEGDMPRRQEDIKEWLGREATKRYLAPLYSAKKNLGVTSDAELVEEAKKSSWKAGMVEYEIDPKNWDAVNKGVFNVRTAGDLADVIRTQGESFTGAVKNTAKETQAAITRSMAKGTKFDIDINVNDKKAAEIEANDSGYVATRVVDLQSVQVIGNTLRILEGGVGQ